VTFRPYDRLSKGDLGKHIQFEMLRPGIQIPIDSILLLRVHDVCEDKMNIGRQPVITKNNIEIRLDALLWVSPTVNEEGINHTFYNLENWQRAIIQFTMTSRLGSDTS
jgi:hypothetical protein